MTHLLDSVILIDHFNGFKKATEYLTTIHPSAAISVITRAEVLVGFNEEDDLKRAIMLLNSFPNLDLTLQIADLAAQLRRRHRWKLPDAFQAAIANYHGIRLATRNTRDFDPDRFDFVTIPYSL